MSFPCFVVPRSFILMECFRFTRLSSGGDDYVFLAAGSEAEQHSREIWLHAQDFGLRPGPHSWKQLHDDSLCRDAVLPCPRGHFGHGLQWERYTQIEPFFITLLSFPPSLILFICLINLIGITCKTVYPCSSLKHRTSLNVEQLLLFLLLNVVACTFTALKLLICYYPFLLHVIQLCTSLLLCSPCKLVN